MPPVRLCAGLVAAVLTLAAAPPALAGGEHPKPTGEELWRTYPLDPSPTAAATAAPPRATATPSPDARRPAPAGDGAPLLPIGLAALAAAGLAAAFAVRHRRGA